MRIDMIGLWRIGSGMVRRLLRTGHQCIVYDIHPETAKALVKEGADGATPLEDFAGKLKPPCAVWTMAPVGADDQTRNDLVPFLERDAVIIDVGNSYDQDDIRCREWEAIRE